MEPDHSGSLMRIAQEYPEMKIVGNAKTFTLIKQFFGTGALSEDRMLEVGEGSTISLGSHPAALPAGTDGTLAGGDDGV